MSTVTPTPAATGAVTGVDPSAASRVAAMRPRRLSKRSRATLYSGLAIVVALIWFFPVYWMINSSMLSNIQLESFRPNFFPVGGTFDNFIGIFRSGSFFSALGMSVAVTLLTVLLCLVFAFLAALAISRFRFKGRRSFILAVLIVQMLPAEGLFIAQYKLLSGLGLINNLLGVTLIYTAAVVPFTVWMLRGFVTGIPIELEEAGMMDGLSRTRAFFTITFPLLAPGLIAAGVFAFLQAWNEFTVALIALQSEASATLPLWLRSFVQASQTRAIDWGEVMAASTVVAVPVIIFFLFVQGRMTEGLVSGAVKG